MNFLLEPMILLASGAHGDASLEPDTCLKRLYSNSLVEAITVNFPC
jgi:hypothetical protein